ncbi:MAG TPA: VTT domain-containing protein [Burkholderiales bacterium]|nr:VTT domain-containing protein [Burkholderiales bacterium]
MSSARRKSRLSWATVAVAAIFVAALAAAWRYTPLSEIVTRENIGEWADAVSETSWAPVIVMVAYIPAAFVLFPRPLLTLLAVVAFGPWLGFACAMGGILLATLATYYAGCAMPEATVKRIAGGKLTQVKSKLRKHGLLAIFLVRLVPIAPFAVEGVIAGAARVKLWQYTLGTILAMAPAVLAETIFGVQISAALKDPSQVNYWIAAAAVLAMAVLTFGLAWWKSRGD